MHPHYRYESLSGDQIRLLILQAGTPSDPLQCDIRTVSIATGPWYEALSYCWGTASLLEQLKCGNEVVDITPGLSVALRQFRSPTTKRILWIDQICIDQRNDEEKGSQVNMMRTIYTQAHCVLVWLGVKDDDTPLAFEIMEDIAQQIDKLTATTPDDGNSSTAVSFRLICQQLKLSPPDACEWKAFRSLLKRPWFTRVWTYQEVALSQQAQVVCGSYSVPWTRFATAYGSISSFSAPLPGSQSYLINDTRIMFSMLLGVHLIRAERNPKKDELQTSGHEFLELLALARMLRPNGATDPRDKLYALLGVANDIDATRKVDYSSHFRSIYCDFTKWFINRYQDLSVLELVNILPEFGALDRASCSNLPSWCPDFRSRSHMNNMRVENGSKISLHGANRLYSATGNSCANMFESELLRLSLHGVYVGQIVELSDPAGNLIGDVAIGARVRSDGQWSALAETHSMNGIYTPTGEPVQMAYSRLRVADYLPGEENASQRRQRKRPVTSLPEPGLVTYSNKEDGMLHYAKDDIGALIIKCTTRQKLYFTDTGYMGLCHLSCNVGDQVYLLMGGDMPFVLRKLYDGTFQFKGQTYVHGIMDGEYLLKSCRGNTTTGDDEWLNSLDTSDFPFETERVILT